ncbi:hypothetical protein HYH03_004353 [Edaphochlamys debaryana]|uniref:Uncharacterized protein n=1 Tax=Edaphochlamys debaryana TaxID=47281 RepID=A0A835Y9I2_9CHLO|nr:hypothetical protein HYH03_004353 [Edaphochlamys debaryana]|eukprot:KAG2497609.1 hypothetical protein HYH03_004353 [Edaphochlamys debaryana]
MSAVALLNDVGNGWPSGAPGTARAPTSTPWISQVSASTPLGAEWDALLVAGPDSASPAPSSGCFDPAPSCCGSPSLDSSCVPPYSDAAPVCQLIADDAWGALSPSAACFGADGASRHSSSGIACCPPFGPLPHTDPRTASNGLVRSDGPQPSAAAAGAAAREGADSPGPTPPPALGRSRIDRDRDALLSACVWEDPSGTPYVYDCKAGGLRRKARSNDELEPATRGPSTAGDVHAAQPTGLGKRCSGPPPSEGLDPGLADALGPADSEVKRLRSLLPQLRLEGPFDWGLGLVGDTDAALGLGPAEAGAGVAALHDQRRRRRQKRELPGAAGPSRAAAGPRAVTRRLLFDSTSAGASSCGGEEGGAWEEAPATPDALLEEAGRSYERDMAALCQSAWSPRAVLSVLPDGAPPSSLGPRLPGLAGGGPRGPRCIATPDGSGGVTLTPAFSCVPPAAFRAAAAPVQLAERQPLGCGPAPVQ